MNDLRFACRQLLKNPGFTAVAMLTLGLGIGANTAIFSLVNELVLRPLPVKDAAELLGVVLTDRSGDYSSQRIPYPIYQDYRAQNRVFSELLAYAPVFAPLQLGEATSFGVVQLASANYFSGLGARPVLGRTFVPADDRTPKQSPVAVISHSCWQAVRCDVNSVLKDEPAVIGRDRTLPARDLLIVGQLTLCLVLLIGAGLCLRSFGKLHAVNPGFSTQDLVVVPVELKGYTEDSVGPFYRDLAQRLESLPGIRAVSYTRVFPLLALGGSLSVPVEQSEGNLRAAIAALRHELLKGNRDLDLTRLQPMRQILSQSLVPQRFILSLLGGFAFCAMLLAGLGIYGVMSYLVTQRTREIGIRMALGAQHWSVLGLVLRHGLGLTVVGTGLGLLGALATTRVLAGVLYGISPTDPLTFFAISWLLAGVACIACYVPARRAAQVDPMVALRYE